MYDDMRGGRPYHWYPDEGYWGDGEKPQPKSPEPPKEKPTGWRAAAREVAVCLGIATVIGLPAYGVADWLYHREIGKPHHGGQVRMTEQNHVELVVKPDRLVVYVTDHEGRPSDLSQTLISAAIGNGSTARRFQNTGNNAAELPGRFVMDAQTMVMVTVDKNCEQPNTAIFTPLSPEPPLPTGLICTVPKPIPAACRQRPSP